MAKNRPYPQNGPEMRSIAFLLHVVCPVSHPTFAVNSPDAETNRLKMKRQ